MRGVRLLLPVFQKRACQQGPRFHWSMAAFSPDLHIHGWYKWDTSGKGPIHNETLCKRYFMQMYPSNLCNILIQSWIPCLVRGCTLESYLCRHRNERLFLPRGHCHGSQRAKKSRSFGIRMKPESSMWRTDCVVFVFVWKNLSLRQRSGRRPSPLA